MKHYMMPLLVRLIISNQPRYQRGPLCPVLVVMDPLKYLLLIIILVNVGLVDLNTWTSSPTV